MAHTLAIVLEIVLEIVLLRVLIVHLEIVFFACNFSGEKESKIVLYFDNPKRVPPPTREDSSRLGDKCRLVCA